MTTEPKGPPPANNTPAAAPPPETEGVGKAQSSGASVAGVGPDVSDTSSAFAWRSETYAWYVVILLTVAFTLSMIDRMLLTLLFDPIKRDLSLNDTQVSLLHGFAFSLFYVFLGLVFGRLADTSNRRTIAGVCVFVWSLMTAAAAGANNFIQLFVTRVGVGVGEAGLSPAANSLISNYFPRERMARPVALYALGIYAGNGLALIGGGAIVDFVSDNETVIVPFLGSIFSWQAAFLVAGIPGMLLALFFLTIKEPPRRDTAASDKSAVSLRDVFKYLFVDGLSYFRLHIVGMAAAGLVLVGSGAWSPSFYMRTFGWSAESVGYVTGTIIMVAGVSGVYTAGWWVERLQAQGRKDAIVRVIFLSLCLGAVPAIINTLMPNVWLALFFTGISGFFLSMPIALSPAALHSITPGDMRGMVYAVYLFFLSVFGYAVGPTVIALFTDFLFGDAQLVKYSIALTAAIFLPVAIFCFSRAAQPYEAMVDRYKERYEE